MSKICRYFLPDNGYTENGYCAYETIRRARDGSSTLGESVLHPKYDACVISVVLHENDCRRFSQCPNYRPG